jgi:formate--tetrahydrofolate ligase
VIATKSALKLADYVVTEAGFGADLGAEKFLDIKCRKAGIKPDCVVVVATLRAMKYQGGADLKELNVENLAALERGVVNLERHVRNMRENFGLPCVVAINHFTFDTEAEIQLLRDKMAQQGVPIVLSRHWAEGGKGAEMLAHTVVEQIDRAENRFQPLYEDQLSLWDKMKTIATKMYGAADISADAEVKKQIKKLDESGYGHFPVCVAKTQYSFTTNPKALGAPSGHTVNIREVRLSAGAEFIVMICGDIMTMPGLPKIPSAEKIDVDETGRVIGLF